MGDDFSRKSKKSTPPGWQQINLNSVLINIATGTYKAATNTYFHFQTGYQRYIFVLDITIILKYMIKIPAHKYRFSFVLPIIIIAGILLLNACKKSEEETIAEVQITKMEDLKVDPSFTFSTSQQVGIEVRMLDNTDGPVGGMRIDINTDDPENGGRLMISGVTDDQGYYKSDYRIPAYMKSVAVVTRAIGFPGIQVMKVENGNVRCILGGKNEPSKLKDGGESLFKSTNSVYVPLGTYNSIGVPNYLEPVNDIIDAAMISDINATLPEYVNASVAHPSYFAETNEPNVVLTQACNVWVTFVHEGAGYKNVLGFYTYNTANPPATIGDIDTVRVIFPNVSFAGSGGGLYSGNRVHLGTFPPGTEIAWMIIADGFVNGTITNGKGRYYSDKHLNPEANASKKQHTIFCNDIGRGKFLLGFEDIKRDAGSDNDFNDAIFYVTADPVQSVVTGNIPLPNYTQTDSDGDGISNVFDDYPADPGKAFNNFFPSQNTNGTLAFEDLWPMQGDYDMNDIVIDYIFNQVTNGQNKVVSITASLTLRAMGAGYRNGFGIQLPIPQDMVSGVTGTQLTEDYITVSANGTEAGQSKATIIVFDNGYQVLQKPPADPFVGVNTSEGCIYVNPVTLNISIDLAGPVNLSVLGTPPYNPFVIADKTRGREIHLINKPPTDLADPALFGTGNDNSIPGNNRYYTTVNNLPWAFDIIDQFDYPYEKKPILNGYTKFVPWSISSGTTYYDWFLPNPGYRNDEYIFQQ